jgi:hypothetical protein
MPEAESAPFPEVGVLLGIRIVQELPKSINAFSTIVALVALELSSMLTQLFFLLHPTVNVIVYIGTIVVLRPRIDPWCDWLCLFTILSLCFREINIYPAMKSSGKSAIFNGDCVFG